MKIKIIQENLIDNYLLYTDKLLKNENKNFEIGWSIFKRYINKEVSEICTVYFNKDILKDIMFANKNTLLSTGIIKDNQLINVKVQTRIKNLVKFVTEVYSSYLKDKDSIKKTFKLKGKLNKIIKDVGDSHNNKYVLILEFTDGRVVYKPRSLKIDNQFYLFTQYLLKRSVRKPKMIIREHYSWQEYIVPYSCLSKEEVIKYYYTLGMYSCIIYLLLGIDIHMENIIAEGSNPVLIDLETLFHNVRPQKNRNPYINTIFETAIFPINEVKRSKDISALTGNFNKMNSSNIVYYKEMKVDPISYLNYLIFGFDETYDKIYHLKNEILDNRLLDRFFINCTTRTVFKHTFYYSKIIDNFLKFNTLCSYDNYKNKKTVYFKYLSNVSDNNLLAKAELQDILNMDIPYFSLNADSKEIIDSRDIIVKTKKKSGIEASYDRIKEMSHIDKNKQIKLLKQIS